MMAIQHCSMAERQYKILRWEVVDEGEGWIRGRSVPSSIPQWGSWKPEGAGRVGNAGIGFDGLLPP